MLQTAYTYCETLANAHYENYPVASFLIQKKLRRPIMVIYAFARYADDIADEGDFPSEKRIQALTQLQNALDHSQFSELPQEAQLILTALQDVIQKHALPIALFQDLLSAFSQDVIKKTYEDETELLDYCRRSANPIGRLLLHLHGFHDAELQAQSDALCTALQLINFIQDIDSDIHERERCYIPLRDLSDFNVDMDALKQGRYSSQIQTLLLQQCTRAEMILKNARPLGAHVHGRFGLEIRTIYHCAQRMLQKLKTRNDLTRPIMKKSDFLLCFLKSFRT